MKTADYADFADLERSAHGFRHPRFCPYPNWFPCQHKPFTCNHLWNRCNLRFTSRLRFFWLKNEKRDVRKFSDLLVPHEQWGRVPPQRDRPLGGCSPGARRSPGATPKPGRQKMAPSHHRAMVQFGLSTMSGGSIAPATRGSWNPYGHPSKKGAPETCF